MVKEKGVSCQLHFMCDAAKKSSVGSKTHREEFKRNCSRYVHCIYTKPVQHFKGLPQWYSKAVSNADMDWMVAC